ncbi:MAG TPA: hypothetical protein VK577_03595 [Bradyrhizobium sp.]|nr:hypothetical protein [Bradyrhizobium sp.]
MTDEQMAVFMGLEPSNPKHLAIVAGLTPEKRAVYESMATLECELRLWIKGLGPKPRAMIDMARGSRRRRT